MIFETLIELLIYPANTIDIALIQQQILFTTPCYEQDKFQSFLRKHELFCYLCSKW
jgi:hypothetical protein